MYIHKYIQKSRSTKLVLAPLRLRSNYIIIAVQTSGANLHRKILPEIILQGVSGAIMTLFQVRLNHNIFIHAGQLNWHESQIWETCGILRFCTRFLIMFLTSFLGCRSRKRFFLYTVMLKTFSTDTNTKFPVSGLITGYTVQHFPLLYLHYFLLHLCTASSQYRQL
jgi:hypothetical protein